MTKSFVMLTNSAIMRDAVKGTIVYKATKHDYGCASGDTAMTGIPHISVSLKPDGDYPFFTHPLRDLKERIDIDNPRTIRPYTQDPSEFVSLEDYMKVVDELKGPGPGYKAMYESCAHEGIEEAHKCFELTQKVEQLESKLNEAYGVLRLIPRRATMYDAQIDACLAKARD